MGDQVDTDDIEESTPRARKTKTSKSKPKFNQRKIVPLPANVMGIIDREVLTRLPEREDDNYYVGDIIFVRMSGYPYWPCMITIDPQTNRYTRRSPDKSGIFYHVQYFGLKAYRSYASPSHIMPFEGRDKYESDLEHLKEVPGTPKAVRKAQLAKLVIKPNCKKDWGIACEEAEAALKMERSQRIKELTFEYIMANELPQAASKRKEGSFLRSQTPKAKKSRKSDDNPLSVFEFDDDSADDLVESKNNMIPTLKLWRQKRANRKGDFSVFWARMRPEVSNDKPDASEEDIKSMLERKWSLLPEDQRSRYFLREEEDDDEPVPAKTPRKASTKKASAVNSGAACTPRPRKSKANTPAKIKTEQSNGEIVKEEVDNSNHIMDEDDNDLSDEERNLIIAEAPQRTRKKRKAEASTSNNVTEGGNVAPVDQAADVPSTPVNTSKKPVKTPRSTRNVRTPKPPKLSVGGDTVEIPVISDTASEEKLEIDVKPKSAKKSQVQSTPSTTRKRTLSKSATPAIEKTPSKRGRKSTANKDELASASKSTKRVAKKHNNSVCIPPLPALDSEETRNSEDASSISENGDAKEPPKRACPQCYNAIENERLVACQGTCLEVFHEKCVPSDFDRKSNLCSECSTGKHLCFICREHTDEVQKCTESDCGKYYHIKCLQKSYPHRMVKDETSEGFICPLHFCLTCYVEHEDNQLHSYKKSSRRLLKCLRCPIAYHFTDECIAAGTSMVCPPLIICPEHYQAKGSSKHVNVNWCFSCNSGGSLICCERCPAAFHRECLEIEPTEGSFFCGDCLVRKQLHYEDIVWVKLGSWRWWPGRICSPKFVPDNIMNYDHSVGQFPVYFYGSKDYYWISQGRAFLFVEGDTAKLTNLKGAKKMYQKAIEEAVSGFEDWKISKKEKNSKLKPPPYHHIKVNRRVGTNKPLKSVGKEENPKDAMCICDPDSENPCGEDSDCYNRVLSIECDSSRCKADDKKCKNRRILKRLDVKTIPFKTEARGWGLKSLVDIKKGQFVIEYVGELINEAECEARIANMIANNETNFYFLTIDKDNIIDAGPKGNLARFMNHSCSPNCETQKWIVNGATRVGLFAKYDIPAGTELTFNYNLNCRGNEKTKCECGAENCSGFLGVRPKPTLEEKMKKPAKLEVKKKKIEPKTISKKTFESLHEDFCFKCGEGGELVMCDKKGCSKSYHLQCLDLEKLPRGTWYCPWHHCDECGKPSARYCSICPTSFCSEHGKEILSPDLEGDLICRDHGDSAIGDKKDEKAPSGLLTSDGPLQVSDSPTDDSPKAIDEKINAESNCEENKVKGQTLDEVDINELKKQTVIDFTEDKPRSPEEMKEMKESMPQPQPQPQPQPEQEAEKTEKERENSPDVSESTNPEEPLTIAESISETPMNSEQSTDPKKSPESVEIPSTTEPINSDTATEKENLKSKTEPEPIQAEAATQPQEEIPKDPKLSEVEKSSELENRKQLESQSETQPEKQPEEPPSGEITTPVESIQKEESLEAEKQHESDTPEVHESASGTQTSIEPEEVKGPTNGIEAVETKEEATVPEQLKQVTDQKDDLTKEESMIFENSQVSSIPHISEKNSEAILTSSTDPEKSIETHVEKSNFTLSPSSPVTDGQKCTN